MPRVARSYQLSRSQIFHVINRGILRQTIFHDEDDFNYFLNILERYKSKFCFLIYHWCIMPNHYHLVMELFDNLSISKIIGACQQIYALYYHRKYKTAGRLLQNRFKSQAIEKEAYLLTCGRYVELNPVRASLTICAWDWKWSSAGFYLKNENDKITSLDPMWEEKTDYKSWLMDRDAIEQDNSLFRRDLNVIGSEEFCRKHVLKNRHAVQCYKGRPRKNGT